MSSSSSSSGSHIDRLRAARRQIGFAQIKLISALSSPSVRADCFAFDASQLHCGRSQESARRRSLARFLRPRQEAAISGAAFSRTFAIGAVCCPLDSAVAMGANWIESVHLLARLITATTTTAKSETLAVWRLHFKDTDRPLGSTNALGSAKRICPIGRTDCARAVAGAHLRPAASRLNRVASSRLSLARART